jgi:septal ring factor EnvC (AmiA/AmiB activator)
MTGVDPAATTPSPSPSERRPGISVRVALVLAALLLVTLGAATAWAVTTNGDLEAARGTLGTTTADLASTSEQLAETKTTLANTANELAGERKAIDANEAKVKVLEHQIERKAACIEAQTTNLAEFRRILALERENFARTTSGSAWAKAVAASDRALDLSIDYLANAYSSASSGAYNTANNWLSKSNAQISVSNRQLKALNAEIDSINAASDAINAANDALGVTLDKTTSTCGG